MAVDTKRKKAAAKPVGLRIVVKYSDYEQDRMKYHRLATSRRRVVIEDDDGQVVCFFGGR